MSPSAIGYPVLVRPSFVLGGRAMAIVYDEQSLDEYMRTAVDASPEKPVLIDKFLERAAEIDVDALADETAVRHRRNSGAHRGSGHSFGRLVLRAAARQDRRGASGDDAPLHAHARHAR